MSQDLALRVTLDLPYEQALEKAVAALKDEGFGVLTEVEGVAQEARVRFVRVIESLAA